MTDISRKAQIIPVSGIDTGVGKTVATGLMARWLAEQGARVITMKMVQTGGSGLSTDIVAHRKLAGVEMYEEDAMGLTCPYVFTVPCSPHLAARLDGRLIDPDVIVNAVEEVALNYDVILLEGSGGLFVPLNEDMTILELISREGWQLILVTDPRLGSVNHTLAALEAIERRDIPLLGLIYNLAQSKTTDHRMIDDSRALFSRRLSSFSPDGAICDIPGVSCTESYCVDFNILFNKKIKEISNRKKQ